MAGVIKFTHIRGSNNAKLMLDCSEFDPKKMHCLDG